jgi:hypothetical protein
MQQGDNITPGRAALREFDPAYVFCGSWLAPVWSAPLLRAPRYGRTTAILKWSSLRMAGPHSQARDLSQCPVAGNSGLRLHDDSAASGDIRATDE